MGKIVNWTFVSIDGVMNHMHRRRRLDDTLVREGTNARLEPLGARALTSGVIILSYRVRGT